MYASTLHLDHLHRHKQVCDYYQSSAARQALQVSTIVDLVNGADETINAGQYGEGVKVEINRLIQAGCTVEYHTANMLWKFGRRRERASSSQDLLYMHSVVQPTTVSDTSMTIAAPVASSGAFEYLDLQETDYIFLRAAGSYDSYCCIPRHLGSQSSFGMEILFDQRDHGRLYVRDFFVCSDPLLKGFGLNYLGTGGSVISRLGLSRDRNFIRVSHLIYQLNELLLHAKSLHPARHKELLLLFLDILQKQPTSALRHLADENSSPVTARDLYSACQAQLRSKFESSADVFLVPCQGSEVSASVIKHILGPIKSMASMADSIFAMIPIAKAARRIGTCMCMSRLRTCSDMPSRFRKPQRKWQGNETHQ